MEALNEPNTTKRRFRTSLWTAASRRTIAHYETRAEDYLRHTDHHAIPENYEAFLGVLPGHAPFTILDFGCGIGRDLRHFRALGHHVTGLDGSPACAEIAARRSGCPVLVQDFLALDLPARHFDGVFANAALFHVPSAVLPKVLNDVANTLKPGGVLFASNPRGGGEEGWCEDRYCCFHSYRGWSRLMRAAGFVELMRFYRPPGRPRREQLWLATLWRRPG